MCTVVVLRRPDHPWPILIAANRDEMIARPWDAPGRYWDDRTGVTAGRDRLAGGTWLAMNDHGLVAAILNRMNTLGPADGKRSRGELPLEAVDHADATMAVDALAHLDPTAYRPFNMIVADNRDAFWLRNTGSTIDVQPLAEGLSMITAHELNDVESSARIANHMPLFASAPIPDPASNDWSAWTEILARRGVETLDGKTMTEVEAAMNVVTDVGFGTVSSSLIALPAPADPRDANAPRPLWKFAAGRPDEVPFEPVSF